MWNEEHEIGGAVGPKLGGCIAGDFRAKLLQQHFEQGLSHPLI
jgi:hypothetical protein